MRIKSYVERATQQSYSHSLAGARVHTKTTLPLLLQYKVAMPDDHYIFSSFWLPSPRFELRTLAGYIIFNYPSICEVRMLLYKEINDYKESHINKLIHYLCWFIKITFLQLNLTIKTFIS
jgi:hypothetical protein